MSGKILECDHCGGPVPFRAPFCAYCRAPLTWEGTPRLERGAPFLSKRYPRDGAQLTFTTTRAEHVAEGTILHVQNPTRFLELDRPTRDVCAVLDAVTLDRGAAFGVVVRSFVDAELFSGYAAMICPGFRSLRLARIVEGATVSTMRVLSDWEMTEAMRPQGQPNQIEIRVADSLFEVLVNDVRVISTLESGVVFGAVGFRVFSLERVSRVLLRSLEAFDVVTAPGR